MSFAKKLFKQNTHNLLFGGLASFGRSINRLYENRNHDIESNGETWLVNQLAKFQPRVIFDVGANTGKYCIKILDSCKKAEVYCFEPVTKTFELLKNKVNNERLHLYKKGLYHENRKLTINLYPSHTHASLFHLKAVPYESTGTEEIELLRGDDFIEQHMIQSIDLLKLDIEGAELDAIKGFEASFNKRIIRVVQFEYGYINITTKNLLIDFYEFFESKDYVVGKLYPKSVQFRKYNFKHEDFIGPNFVAVHKDDRELLKAFR